MNTLFRIVAHFSRDMEVKLSTSKTYIWSYSGGGAFRLTYYRVPFDVNRIVVYKVLLLFYHEDIDRTFMHLVSLQRYAIELDPCLVVPTLVQCGQPPMTLGYFLWR